MSTTNERPSAIGEIIANPASLGSAIGKAASDAFAKLPMNLSAKGAVAAIPGLLQNPFQQTQRPLLASAPVATIPTTRTSSWWPLTAAAVPTTRASSWWPSTAAAVPTTKASSWWPSTAGTVPTTRASSWWSSTTAAVPTTSASSWWSSARSTSYNSYNDATNRYWMHVTYYFTLYSLLVFLVLVVINYTITPIFSFYPGSPGIIPIPGLTNDLVYWNNKTQPAFSDPVPKKDDKLYGKSYVNMFSFGIDLYVRELSTSSASNRLILYKASAPVSAPPKIDATFTGDSFINYMKKRSSMIMYLTDTNDLVITFFSGSKQYNTAPIKNIPLYTPFRITLVVEDKMFTTYLNSKQVFQRLVPELIAMPSDGNSGMQLFYSSPEWTNNPRHSIYVQNFHVWSRPITYKEVISARPALALDTDFGLSPDAGTPCASDSASIVAGSKKIVDTVKEIFE
jgi:hypothetical protein